MLFQHFVADDFANHHDLLSKKITIETMQELLAVAPEPCILMQEPHESRSRILFTKHNHIGIFGKPFDKNDRPRKYNSLKTWLDEGGFPVMCNVPALRQEYPEYNLMSDTVMCMSVYDDLFNKEQRQQTMENVL